MSGQTEKARRQFEAGKYRAMATTLWHVKAEVLRRPTTAEAQELLDLALMLREHTTSRRVAKECDYLESFTQEILNAGVMATIPPPKSNIAALIILSIAAAICLVLFFYVRTLTTVSHALVAGWSLKEGPALIMQVALIAIFILCVGLAIRSVTRTAPFRPQDTIIEEGAASTGEIGPNSGPRGDVTLVSQRLRELASLHEQGLISDEEFAAKRAAMLDDL